MTGLIAYVQWLSQGQPTGREFPGRGLVHWPELTPNVQHGEKIYMQVPWEGRRWDAAHATSGVETWGLQCGQDGSIRPAQHDR